MKKILIVDDELMMLKIADRALKNDYETILVDSGEAAVELFVRSLPDMVISDIKMPSMSGYELQRLIKSKAGVNVPFIFLTSDDSKESENKGLEMGAADYIKKPVRADELLSRVNRVFDNAAGKTVSDNDNADISKTDPKDNEFIDRELEKLPKWIIEEPLIDAREGIKNCASAEAYLSSIDIFIRHISNNIEILEKCFAEGDIENYTIKAHGLKSTSRIIGCMTLSAKALEMENAANENNIEFIKNNHIAFIEECRRHEKALLDRTKEEEKEEISDEEVQDALMAIREFAIEEDFDIVQSIVDSLMKRALKPEDYKKISSIKIYLNSLEWDEIRNITNAI